MWKPEDRLAADGIGLRYLSDLTDGKWAIIEPMVPLATHGGRRGHDPWLQEQSCLGVILAYLRNRPGSPNNLIIMNVLLLAVGRHIEPKMLNFFRGGGE